VAECLEIPGCLSQGKTKEEALENIQDANRECLSVMLEDQVKDGHDRTSHA
jgi:predicted RNase H-like HicB family nuclease